MEKGGLQALSSQRATATADPRGGQAGGEGHAQTLRGLQLATGGQVSAGAVRMTISLLGSEQDREGQSDWDE